MLVRYIWEQIKQIVQELGSLLKQAIGKDSVYFNYVIVALILLIILVLFCTKQVVKKEFLLKNAMSNKDFLLELKDECISLMEDKESHDVQIKEFEHKLNEFDLQQTEQKIKDLFHDHKLIFINLIQEEKYYENFIENAKSKILDFKKFYLKKFKNYLFLTTITRQLIKLVAEIEQITNDANVSVDQLGIIFINFEKKVNDCLLAKEQTNVPPAAVVEDIAKPKIIENKTKEKSESKKVKKSESK